jgi:nicotinate phosphoribosyltransferase
MIITSALDQDTYKFSMSQAILHQFSGAEVEYQFKCRTEKIDFRGYIDEILREFNKFCRNTVFTPQDIEYLGDTLPWLKKDYLQFLRLYRFEGDYVHINADDKGDLHVRVSGPWLHTILFEMPILQIISEVWSKDQGLDYEGANKRTLNKAILLKGIGMKVAEFGGRRRASVEAHRNALKILLKECPDNIIGSSNVMFAKEFGIKPIGTMAHEWLQAHQALYRVADSQTMALENWAKEYRGDLGIALSDVIGLKYFLHDFDMFFSKLFDGTRQDSGDPFEYGEKMIDHYEKMGIDPKTKTIVFSDGLNIENAYRLFDKFNKRIKVSFGIGTHITNDFPDFKALQIVLKMTKCNGSPVAKLSDSAGKTMCLDNEYNVYVRTVFDRRIKNAGY